MANLHSVARPYALAAFEIARDKQQLPEWRSFLDAAVEVTRNSTVNKLLVNPEFSSHNALELYSEVLAGRYSAEQNNFLHLLSQSKRLIALPDIQEIFLAYYAALEKISTVRVVTALEIKDEDFRKNLTSALTRRIKHDVKLKCEVDPTIMGGAIIHIGDRVIDDSIRGKLARLLEFSLR